MRRVFIRTYEATLQVLEKTSIADACDDVVRSTDAKKRKKSYRRHT